MWCIWLNESLMNVFVCPTFFWMSTCALYLNFSVFSLSFRFFFSWYFVCCYGGVYFMCIEKSVVQPKQIIYQMAFMLDVTKGEFGSKTSQNQSWQVHHSVFLRASDVFFTNLLLFFMFYIICLCVTNHLSRKSVSLLEPNTSDIDADKLFLIILTSLNCFLALYHLCASV